MTVLSLLPHPRPRNIARPLRSQEVPADDRDILKDTPPEGEERDEVQVDAEAVTQEREARGEQEVRIEAGDEDARVEVSFELTAV